VVGAVVMVRELDVECGFSAALYSGAAVRADVGIDPDVTGAATPWWYGGDIGVAECVEQSGSPICITLP
jgi:hypothetical protein